MITEEISSKRKNEICNGVVSSMIKENRARLRLTKGVIYIGLFLILSLLIFGIYGIKRVTLDTVEYVEENNILYEPASQLKLSEGWADIIKEES